MQYNLVQYSAILYHTMQYSAILYHTMQYILYRTVHYSTGLETCISFIVQHLDPLSGMLHYRKKLCYYYYYYYYYCYYGEHCYIVISDDLGCLRMAVHGLELLQCIEWNMQGW